MAGKYFLSCYFYLDKKFTLKKGIHNNKNLLSWPTLLKPLQLQEQGRKKKNSLQLMNDLEEKDLYVTYHTLEIGFLGHYEQMLCMPLHKHSVSQNGMHIINSAESITARSGMLVLL